MSWQTRDTLLGRTFEMIHQDGPLHAPDRRWTIFERQTQEPLFTLIMTDANHPRGTVLGHFATLPAAQACARADRIARLHPEPECRG